MDICNDSDSCDEDFATYQSRIAKCCRNILKCANDMSTGIVMAGGVNERCEFMQQNADKVTQEMQKMVKSGGNIVLLADSDEVRKIIIINKVFKSTYSMALIYFKEYCKR